MKKTVLVADDNKALVEALRIDLEGDCWQVFCAYSGEQALESFHENKPDIVLLDINMPGPNGFQCAAILPLLEERRLSC